MEYSKYTLRTKTMNIYIDSVYAQYLMEEHGYLFFGDERAYAVMQAKVADKGGRSALQEVPNPLYLAIST